MSSAIRQDRAARAGFAADVREGLTRPEGKRLPSRYLYDAIGSALFDVITLLPEYGLTRADERLLDRHAAEAASRLQPGAVVAELGSGRGSKTRRILSELAVYGRVDYFPIDISATALERCQSDLQDIAGVTVHPLADSYLDGLEKAVRLAPPQSQLLLLFLGSTIGNFDRPAARTFIRNVRRAIRPGDVLLLGTDLEKPAAQLLAAYDDPAGVTAAFNKNVLARINRELGGTFDLTAFEHAALYHPTERRIEMHLRAGSRQTVRIAAADLSVTFQPGETIWTESSHKFNGQEVREMGAAAGFRCDAQWVDVEWPFAETWLTAV